MQQLKDYFNFNRIERGGIIVLFFLLMLLIFLNIFLPYFINEETFDSAGFENEIIAFEESQKRITDSIDSQKKNTKFKSISLNPFPFDPNGLPENKWAELGLSEWQIKVIKNYEAKGGRFYNKNDFEKMYSISKEEFEVLEPYIRIEKQYDKISKQKPQPIEIHPFTFDPNELNEKGWLSMGLRKKLVKVIINYRNKGGKFYNKEDVKNIYGMQENEYNTLEPFISIRKDTLNFLKKKSIAEGLLLEINSVDTLDLQQLKGIGPSYARRIVKYRNRLGGYCSTEQLLEVFGMDSLRFSGIQDNLFVEVDSVQKININDAGIKQLIKHPYIEFYLAKSIVSYRKEIGTYTNTEQLKNANLIYEELYMKIKPYICLN